MTAAVRTHHEATSAARPRVVACVCLVVLLGGCHPPLRKNARYYNGPTQSMNEVVSRINANNQRLQTLYLNHNFAAEIVERTKDGKQRKTAIDGSGVIMYQAPDNLYMNGRHPIGGKLFTLGCNPKQYWLAVDQEKVDAIWYGRTENVGKPCVKEMPLRPDLLMEVLGVFTFDPNFARFPAPVMKFNNDEDVYMFTWVMPQADRFVPVKEVWYDRQTMRPRLVNLFGSEGRILLRAYLSNPRHVKIDGVAEDQQPYIAGKYDLLFMDTQSRMTIEISDAYLKYKGAPEPRVFHMPSPDNYGNSHELDEACGD
jgi:hypothetical protein